MRALPPAADARRVRTHSVTDASVVIAIATVCAAAAELVLMRQPPAAPWLAALFPAGALVYVAAGLVAWTRRPNSRLGVLMVIGGGVWLLTGLSNTEPEALRAVGTITRTLGIGVIVHLLLAFPTGRLQTTAERIIVIGTYATCLVLEAPLWLFSPGSVIAVADRPEIVDATLVALRIAGSVVAFATAIVLARRQHHASPEQRRVLAPLNLYGILAVLLVPWSSVIAHRCLDGGGMVLPAVQLTLLGLLPVAFVVAASRGGFARTADIAELGNWLGTEDAARPALRQALADALGDPTLRLLFRLPGDDALVDDRGVTFQRPEPRGPRDVVEIELVGEPVGAIEYDATLIDRPGDVEDAGRVIALALDRERLVVELRASRNRLVAAADDERRRIARDLHDGLQSRLVFLAVQAGTGADAATVRTGIEAAIDELRDLVDGVMPAQLTECGLPAAVEDLADRLPIPMRLSVSGFEHRLPQTVETAAYFVVSEAIVNAVKHTSASSLDVHLERSGGILTIQVSDAGGGGAHHTRGTGLRGMDDRVAALDGRLTVESTTTGTRVKAVVPCAS